MSKKILVFCLCLFTICVTSCSYCFAHGGFHMIASPDKNTEGVRIVAWLEDNNIKVAVANCSTKNQNATIALAGPTPGSSTSMNWIIFDASKREVSLEGNEIKIYTFMNPYGQGNTASLEVCLFKGSPTEANFIGRTPIYPFAWMKDLDIYGFQNKYLIKSGDTAEFEFVIPKVKSLSVKERILKIKKNPSLIYDPQVNEGIDFEDTRDFYIIRCLEEAKVRMKYLAPQTNLPVLEFFPIDNVIKIYKSGGTGEGGIGPRCFFLTYGEKTKIIQIK